MPVDRNFRLGGFRRSYRPLIPPPESLSRALQKMILLGDKPQPLWILWLVVGLTPALCEEFFFRGMVCLD